eukprot:CAMPEP_0119361874 /NCGR_PEP_ID=MMETSP1334-20130426/9093_1 /TAXON_ID=127549 /ORGANISM="Calcidiscus leptoporus, Strain RCC1130" /LENGTH=133 /DNA_ID=CAMNT_0007376993 /DNA_START=237 /DNA_END=634 /DNA_ORIENTATION=+
MTSAHVTTRGLAARQIVHIHVRLPQGVDRRFRVAAEASADGVGDDAKPLAELVDEAEGVPPLDNGGSDEEHSRNLRRLVLVRQQGCAGKAAFRLLPLRQVEQVAGDGGHAPFKSSAQHGRLCSVHHQLAPFGA